MSEASSPVAQRDIRSAAKAFKRDRDSGEKWANGTRPMAGVRIKYNLPGSEEAEQDVNMKVRPGKPATYVSRHTPKIQANIPSHAPKSQTPKIPKANAPFDNAINHRMVRKVDSGADSAGPLSKSLLELLPQHANNSATSIQTAIRDQESGILYSYDNIGASPGVKGRPVGLDSLVEMAEKKWNLEQTDKLVKGEYEVLDNDGETTVLSSKKGKKSPKQKAKNMPLVQDVQIEEDDGFELI